MRVTHFQRKPGKGTYSLERFFTDVRCALPSDIVVDVSVNRYHSPRARGGIRWCSDMLRASRSQADVNHVTGDSHYLTFLLDRRRTVLTILDCGSLERLRAWRRWAVWLFWFWLPARRCSVITVISHFTKNELVKAVGCDPAKVEVIHCSVSPEFSASRYVFNRGCPTILQVGTKYNKNVEGVAAALSGFACRLIVVGELSDEQVTRLREYRIEFENVVDVTRNQLLDAYRRADIVMFASFYEGFGLPIVEANAVGRPIVTSDVASMPEIGADAACYVNPYDPASIRAGVERICEDEGYRLQLINNGFRNVQRFAPSRIAQQFAELYRRVGKDAVVL